MVTIVQRLESSGESEIKVDAISALVMEALATLDQVAYVRFASVYRNSAKQDFEFITDELAEESIKRLISAICAWLTLARRGLGNVAQSGGRLRSCGRRCSIVGAVGRSRVDGHAETQALDQAGTKAKGGTAYVTLEPCSHAGKTPPCAEALITAGVSRVVISIEDPDDRVSGRG